ncbi:16S rRNA (uracil(1498)-N(3))-methyltransferase [soil metagenome]
MTLPFFYTEKITSDTNELVLNEETSKHVVQVLRMQIGEQLQLTDGQGNISTAIITDGHKKSCKVKIISNSFLPQSTSKNTIAISLVKNAHRFEWFLEKATEIGITEIIPLICTRTEKQHFRFDRMKGILISAMLQSQQCWLPVLHEPVRFKEFANGTYFQQKLIAHCEEDAKQSLTSLKNSSSGTLICIGPEGDFTADEIYQATESAFLPVALGNTRLRTETAGVVAATLLCMQ